MEFPARIRLALSVLLSLALSACSGGGSSGSNPVPAASPRILPTTAPTTSPSSSPGAFNETAFSCPANDTAASAARGGGAGAATVRRLAAVGRRGTQTADGLLAVAYARETLGSSRAVLSAREQHLGATLVSEYDFPHAGLTTRILSVAPAQAASVEAALRTQTGVRSVGPVALRYKSTVTNPYYPSDPYFNGFTAAQNAAEAVNAPTTYHVPPYVESQTVPGQWGMHAVQLEHAFGYSQAGNAPVVNLNALGSSNVKIALIDTGQDTTHPELASKVVYQKCYITNPNGVQSVGNFTTDPDGHGTNVAGIAAAATGNGLGFTGAGGNAVIYGYRIFPTPDDNCSYSSNFDAQCSATTADIASAIGDAIANNVNVISLSLGGGACKNGVDDDSTEGNAIAEAIAHNIIVVAAAGNSTGPPLEAPACDAGVIAVGATSLADGRATGAGAGGSASNPTEYVASYSSYGSPATALHSASAWGIVAPGGDPVNSYDSDELHWIENIYTSTPFDSTDAGTCRADYGSSGGQTDCRIEIAGTSMATPVVAGAAALILAVSSAYQSPTAMKALLCTTADDLGSNSNEGCGRLNVYRAMAYALADPTKP